MTAKFCLIAAASLLAGSASAAGTAPTDPQIAHIAYTAGTIDIEAAKLALQKSKSKAVREFASEMVRDHEAVNEKALALVKKLHGKAFDKAYAANEVAYHQTVNGALKSTLIPSANNGELKSLLETGLTLFGEHQKHAEHLSASLR